MNSAMTFLKSAVIAEALKESASNLEGGFA
jgi:hypothetical protein